ncbi:MAG: nitroreductase [Rhodocyclaceae bacterium]|jgi:nitroreductase|nr:nitroreductase [Rhodocyclaceae bacterium]
MTVFKDSQIIDRAIASRRSVRAFLDTPVDLATVRDILQVASRAPSGTNTQPWKVYVLTGEAKQRLSQEIVETFLHPEKAAEHHEEYDYYPSKWIEPFIGRRRKVGFDLYGLLGLSKDDKDGMKHQHAKNYQFFDAPVGLIFTIDRVMGRGSFLDYGMFMENVMISAIGHGLATCAQAAFNQFHKIIERQLCLPENEAIVCGMAMGYEDKKAIINTLKTTRVPVEDFVKFVT